MAWNGAATVKKTSRKAITAHPFRHPTAMVALSNRARTAKIKRNNNRGGNCFENTLAASMANWRNCFYL